MLMTDDCGSFLLFIPSFSSSTIKCDPLVFIWCLCVWRETMFCWFYQLLLVFIPSAEHFQRKTVNTCTLILDLPFRFSSPHASLVWMDGECSHTLGAGCCLWLAAGWVLDGLCRLWVSTNAMGGEEARCGWLQGSALLRKFLNQMPTCSN